MNYIKLLNAAFEKFYDDTRPIPSHISLYMALFQEWNSCRFADEFYVSRQEIMRMAKIGSKSTYHRCITELHKWEYLTYFPSNNPFRGSRIKMTVFWTDDEAEFGQKDYSPELELLAEQYSPKSVSTGGHQHPKNELPEGQHHPKNVPLTGQRNPKDEPLTGQEHPITVLIEGHQSPKNGQPLYRHRPISGQRLVSNINNTKHTNSNKQSNGWQAVLKFFLKKGFDENEAKTFFDYYSERNWHTPDGESIRNWHAVAMSWMDGTEFFGTENETNDKQPSHFRDNLKISKSKNYGEPL